MTNCLKCVHWTTEARETADGGHWCRHLQTWTRAGFFCADYSEQLAKDGITDWYTIAEVAVKCHVSEGTVRYWIATGRLKAFPMSDDTVKLSGQFRTQWRIDKLIADKYIAWYNSIVAR